MLIHCSVRVADHDKDARLAQEIFDRGRYGTSGSYSRLEDLWDTDYRKVTEQMSPESPQPKNYRELKPYIDQCVSKIGNQGSEAVRIVNGDKKNEEHMPNFDRDETWSILVGGTKLSRGYTVEGLTVSYYRRKIKMADTLMQVGRWFGFRRGYKDLVRLYVGRQEPDGKKGTMDMYLAFKSICRDEEAFRDDLRKYADPKSSPRIRPVAVPPLVPSHLLPPTAANKMWHAKIQHQNLGASWKERVRTAVKQSDRKKNADLFSRLVSGCDQLQDVEFPDRGSSRTWRSKVWAGGLSDLKSFIKDYIWAQTGLMQREIEFLNGKGEKNPQISRCLVLCPQKAGVSVNTWHEMSVFERNMTSDGVFNAFSEPHHRAVAEAISLNEEPDWANSALRTLVDPETAVVVIYPVVGKVGGRVLVEPGDVRDSEITIGFGVHFPRNKIKTPVTYTTGE